MAETWMDEFEREPDVKIARLMARIRPRWDVVRTENNLTAILERLRGPHRWRHAWSAMLAATRLRYRTYSR